MPKFSTYDATARVAGPVATQSASPLDFGAGVAAGIGNVGAAGGNAALAISQRRERDDAAQLNVLRSQAMSDLTAQITELQNNEPLGAPDHVAKVQEAIDAYYLEREETVATPKGQQLLMQQREQIKSAFVQNAIRYQAASKGAKAVSDFTTSVSNDRHTLMQNPDMFDVILQANKVAINDPEGILSRSMDAKALKALEDETVAELAIAAAEGYIDRDPFAAKDLLEDDAFNKYLDTDAVQKLDRQADLGIKAIERDQKLAEERFKEQQKAKREETKSNFLNRMFLSGDLTNKEILSSNLEASEKVAYMKLLEDSQNGGKVTTDPFVYNELQARVSLPDGDPNKITDETELDKYLVSGQLTIQDAKTLRGEIDRNKKPESKIETSLMSNLASRARAEITGTNDFLGIKDVKGEQLYYEWYSQFIMEYNRLKDEGHSMSELLMSDSKMFLGNTIGKFVRTPAERMQDQFNVSLQGLDEIPEQPAAEAGTNVVPIGPTINLDLAEKTGVTKDNRKVYLINGKWVYEDGSEYK